MIKHMLPFYGVTDWVTEQEEAKQVGERQTYLQIGVRVTDKWIKITDAKWIKITDDKWIKITDDKRMKITDDKWMKITDDKWRRLINDGRNEWGWR